MRGGSGPGVTDPRFLPDQIRDMGVHAACSAGIHHPDDLVPRDLRKGETVFFHLAHDVFVRKIRQCRMRQGMPRDLMPLVDGANLAGTGLHMGDRHVLPDERTRLSEKPRIDVEGAFQPVFVEKTDETLVLRHAVVVAERHRFHFSLKHDRTPFRFLIYGCSFFFTGTQTALR